MDPLKKKLVLSAQEELEALLWICFTSKYIFLSFFEKKMFDKFFFEKKCQNKI